MNEPDHPRAEPKLGSRPVPERTGETLQNRESLLDRKSWRWRAFKDILRAERYSSPVGGKLKYSASGLASPTHQAVPSEWSGKDKVLQNDEKRSVYCDLEPTRPLEKKEQCQGSQDFLNMCETFYEADKRHPKASLHSIVTL